jgi:hypothetical protein
VTTRATADKNITRPGANKSFCIFRNIVLNGSTNDLVEYPTKLV